MNQPKLYPHDDIPEFSSAIKRIAGFETSPTLAIAVSGGADSMALLLLARDWAKKRGGNVIALTVDHGLRAQSRDEALQVASWCKIFGIAHQLLTWSPPAINASLPAQARDARYQLMTAWCRAHHILHLLSAHHQDDQAETLFMRVARGSFIDGLACMPPIKDMHGIRLIRPLLNVSKSRLVFFLESKNQSWVEDPTNQNPIYTRNHLRQMLQSTVDSSKISQTTNSFGNIRNILENKLSTQLTNCVSIFQEAYAMIYMPAFQSLASDYALRALSNLTVTLSGQTYPPRTEKLQRLYEEILSKKIGKGRSFFGLMFIHQATSDRLLVYRERKAIEPPHHLTSGEAILWDQRFLVCTKSDVTVRALGADGLKKFKTQHCRLPAALPKSVAAALPSFWRLEELLAVPHIHYGDKESYKAAFRPAKPLAGAAFSSMTRLN